MQSRNTHIANDEQIAGPSKSINKQTNTRKQQAYQSNNKKPQQQITLQIHHNHEEYHEKATGPKGKQPVEGPPKGKGTKPQANNNIQNHKKKHKSATSLLSQEQTQTQIPNTQPRTKSETNNTTGKQIPKQETTEKRKKTTRGTPNSQDQAKLDYTTPGKQNNTKNNHQSRHRKITPSFPAAPRERNTTINYRAVRSKGSTRTTESCKARPDLYVAPSGDGRILSVEDVDEPWAKLSKVKKAKRPSTRAKDLAQKVKCLLGKAVSPNRSDIQPRVSASQGCHRPAQGKESTRQGPLVQTGT
ncbi:hypothetical protein CHS0354_018162 [Potamilus streckersoni]|uniref:Uncharacterized protein n=1 Tax=Potamilus streckersoni TaxID=2493646 RepID=A0AAE0ST61_9BIVA|nr:hypothetical protein CHS0354_018162 [Potamilus streckersoni]